MGTQLSARQTLWLILLPMLATFVTQRLFLHLVGVHHVRTGGLIIHHLFFGVALVLPAAFILAFGVGSRLVASLTRVALGCGSAMVLDEIVYLVATQASDGDYASSLSLRGAIVFMSLGVVLLIAIYRFRQGAETGL